MRFLPAVDIVDGSAVRLVQGDYARQTTFGDAMTVVEGLVEDGIDALHLVDLDAARNPDNQRNWGTLVDCVQYATSHGVFVEFGGGVRSPIVIDRLLQLGVDRVIIGTSAAEPDTWVANLAPEIRARVVISLDFRVVDSIAWVAADAWQRVTSLRLFDAVAYFAELGFSTQLMTPVARDGMATGPDVALYADVIDRFPIDLIASGGVRDAADLAELAQIDSHLGSIDGVVVGSALYHGTLTVAEGLAVCNR